MELGLSDASKERNKMCCKTGQPNIPSFLAEDGASGKKI
jgi:hypothetical protein